jgi:hypothetical protein
MHSVGRVEGMIQTDSAVHGSVQHLIRQAQEYNRSK